MERPGTTRTNVNYSKLRLHLGENTERQGKNFSPGFWILLAAIAAMSVKLGLAWNTLGTNDTVVFFLSARELSLHGLAETYRREILFNHPPLVAYYLRAIYQLSHWAFFVQHHISFAFLLRLPGIMADLVSSIIACKLAQKLPGSGPPLWALVLFALNPISIMVSGFHGNTDSVMVMFLLLSCLMLTRPSPLLCGLFLCLSCQVKIVALLLLPVFFLFWRHRRRSPAFVIAFVVPSALLTLEPLIFSQISYLKNVLAYGGYWGLWGFTYLIRLLRFQQLDRISFFGLAPAATMISSFLKLTVVCFFLFLAWRRRASDSRGLLVTVALSWLIFFICAPGVAPQYFVWLTPFLLFFSPVFFVCFIGAASIFLFIFYTTICHSMLWYFGVSTNALSAVWAPWSLLPWITLIGGLILICRSTLQEGHSVKFLAAVRAAKA